MIRIVLVLVIVFSLCNCTNYSPELTEALVLSGENRKELLRVLEHYEQEEDTLKYKAACFLIENMRWHRSFKKTQYVDSRIPKLYEKFDYLYTKILDGFDEIEALDSNQFLREEICNYPQVIHDLMKITPLDTNVVVSHGVFEDVNEIDASFLISHVDNAFRVWRESKYAKHLNFDAFCEYILPYRSFWGTTFYYSGEWLNKQFGKQIWRGNTPDFLGHLKRCNHYANRMLFFSYPFKLKERIGIYDLFLGTNNDCALLADNYCNIFRSCGFPVTVDYTIAYKAYTSRHFYCNFLDSTGGWWCFNPGSNKLSKTSPVGHSPLNLYRNTFAAQKNSPYFLKAKMEEIPGELASPCIKDVTAEQYEVVELTLPFTNETKNNLAYLCTFSGNFESGIIAVTWGTIDRKNKQVTFKYALYNTLYIPMYMKNGSLCPFGQPFYLLKDSLGKSGYRLCHLCDETNVKDRGDLLLTRKFPLKSYLMEEMKHMIGGRFEGAHHEDFSDAKVLFTITETPKPYWQEYILNNCQKYQYYRYVAPESYPWANIAELEFLVRGDITYPHTSSATPLPVFKEEDISSLQNDYWVQVMEKDISSMRNKVYFDKNVMTNSWRRFNPICLAEPFMVERVRMIPRNADNGIRPGDRYLLQYWDNGWKKFGIQKAMYHFLKFKDVPLNKIYWLRNLDRGIEDFPFIYKEGQQKFIYDSVIVDNKMETK